MSIRRIAKRFLLPGVIALAFAPVTTCADVCHNGFRRRFQ